MPLAQQFTIINPSMLGKKRGTILGGYRFVGEIAYCLAPEENASAKLELPPFTCHFGLLNCPMALDAGTSLARGFQLSK
jgi:hypothetical protein